MCSTGSEVPILINSIIIELFPISKRGDRYLLYLARILHKETARSP